MSLAETALLRVVRPAVLACASAWLAALATAQVFDTPLASGDVDGDGYDDVVVAACDLDRAGGCGEVHVIDGRRGVELWRVVGVPGELRVGFGVAVVTAGVVEPLVIVAASDLASLELVLDLHEGSSGRRVGRFRLPPSAKREWSCSLAPLDDVDGDGSVELAVGRGGFSGAAEHCGRVSLMSLRDGRELAAIEGTERYQGLGGRVVRGRFDERPGSEIVVTELVQRERALRWLSSPALALIGVTPAPVDGSSFGPSIATLGDWDADGLDDVVVGAHAPPYYDDGTNRGEARVYGVRTHEPLYAVAVGKVEDNKGPFVAALPNGPDSLPLIAFATPWESWSAGIVRIFEADQPACIRAVAWQESGDNYYGVGLAPMRVPGRTRPELVTVGQTRMESRALSGVAIECLGGDGGLDRRWRYELDARPAAARARDARLDSQSAEEPCRFATRAFRASSQATGALPPRPLVALATGDVDGDGYDDASLAYVHADGRRSGGALHVVDGKRGSRLWSVSSFAAHDETILGTAVVASGVDTPFVVAAVREGVSRELRLDLLHGKTGERVRSIVLPPCAEEWTCAIEPLDDVDGDGVIELAVGRPWFTGEEPRAGRVSIVSLVDGCELATIEGQEADEGLGRVLAVGRFDARDGLDLATTAHRAHSTCVLWLSSRDLAPIAHCSTTRFDFEFATSLATVGDCDLDARDEIAVTARRSVGTKESSACTEIFVLAPGASVAGADLVLCGEHVDWPSTAVLHGVASEERHLALGVPGRSVIQGEWHVFDDRFAVERRVLDRRRTVYPLSLAAAAIHRDPPSRLLVAGASLVAGVDHYLVDLECWGGPAWTTCLWSYELEPRAR